MRELLLAGLLLTGCAPKKAPTGLEAQVESGSEQYTTQISKPYTGFTDPLGKEHPDTHVMRDVFYLDSDNNIVKREMTYSRNNDITIDHVTYYFNPAKEVVKVEIRREDNYILEGEEKDPDKFFDIEYQYTKDGKLYQERIFMDSEPGRQPTDSFLIKLYDPITGDRIKLLRGNNIAEDGTIGCAMIITEQTDTEDSNIDYIIDGQLVGSNQKKNNNICSHEEDDGRIDNFDMKYTTDIWITPVTHVVDY